MPHTIGGIDPLPVWAESGVVPTEPQFTEQRWWSMKVYDSALRYLKPRGTARDQGRKALQSEHGATAWLAPTPSAALGYDMPGPEFRLLLRWWLGCHVAPASIAGSPCPLCAAPLDPLGDHTVSYPRNRPIDRHSGCGMPSSKYASLTPVEEEVQDPEQPGRQRPGDLYLPGWWPWTSPLSTRWRTAGHTSRVTLGP